MPSHKLRLFKIDKSTYQATSEDGTGYEPMDLGPWQPISVQVVANDERIWVFASMYSYDGDDEILEVLSGQSSD